MTISRYKKQFKCFHLTTYAFGMVCKTTTVYMPNSPGKTEITSANIY